MGQSEGTSTPIYGYCPRCGSPGVSRVRTLDAWTTCSRGHKVKGERMLERRSPASHAAILDEIDGMTKEEIAGYVQSARGLIPDPHSELGQRWLELVEQATTSQMREAFGDDQVQHDIEAGGAVIEAALEEHKRSERS